MKKRKKMNVDEIIDKIKLAIEFCCDGEQSPFRKEEVDEMYNFLNSQKYQEHSSIGYTRGKEPRWKVGDTLAYYECCSDHEGEVLYGKVIKIELDEELDDWYYCFDDECWDSEECMLENETYVKNIKK